jgi:hypothetical protein
VINIDMLTEYEQGSMSEDDAVEMFQDMVSTGIVWELQGHYGRTAAQLIRAGLIQTPSMDIFDDEVDIGGEVL